MKDCQDQSDFQPTSEEPDDALSPEDVKEREQQAWVALRTSGLL